MNQPFRREFDPKNLRHWCFDDCPQAELMACWHYEYLRDCPSVIDRVLAWRKKWPQEQYSRAEIILNIFGGHPYERLIAEWPQTPYLDIDPKSRRIYLDVLKRLGAMTRDCIANRQLRERQTKDPVASFPIMDWNDPIAEQIKQLRKFVRDNRPRNCVVDRRGQPTVARFLRQRLKALGAWRLSHVMSQSEVINYTFVRLGKPLYKNQPELSKVVNRVTDYLIWLDQTPVDP